MSPIGARLSRFPTVPRFFSYNERSSAEDWMDTQFLPYNAEIDSEMSLLFGPKFMSSSLYQLCSEQVI
ncbi:hypothetical protein Hanom_Chr17g01568981 [Helianthus anomalus]